MIPSSTTTVGYSCRISLGFTTIRQNTSTRACSSSSAASRRETPERSSDNTTDTQTTPAPLLLFSYQYSSLLCRIAGVLSEAQLMHHIVVDDERCCCNTQKETRRGRQVRERDTDDDPGLAQPPLSPALCPPLSLSLSLFVSSASSSLLHRFALSFHRNTFIVSSLFLLTLLL